MEDYKVHGQIYYRCSDRIQYTPWMCGYNIPPQFIKRKKIKKKMILNFLFKEFF